MKCRYKDTKTEFSSYTFNVHALSEILTGDDTVSTANVDVFINGKWKDMHQAFEDKDIVPDNYNRFFGPPENEIAKARGYNE
jgi:hypothetical protein